MQPAARPRRPVFHLVANSHLDPVWLWDAREGLNEAINTVLTVLDLMRERPELRYIRGESLVYEQVRRHAPAAFREIRRLVRKGRWDPVGGTYLQPDLNLPAVETLHRHFEVGQEFLRAHFGRPAWAGWSADCFGHTPFLPDILRAHGLRAYAFGRPKLPADRALFWWESPNGARVLAATYLTGWYGCERDEIPARLDACLAAAPALPVRHVLVPFGLGDHGGGPTRRHVDDIAAWAGLHPQVEVRHSTLHGYFGAVERELRAGGVELPRIRGELGQCMRGTYSAALRVKTAYRRAEAQVIRAGHLVSLLPATASRGFRSRLDELWRGVLFNSFHDILPGTAVPRALEEQAEELGSVRHHCRALERDALLVLAPRAPRVAPAPLPADHPEAVSLLVVNPRPEVFRGPLELEAQLDHRPVWPYAGRPSEVPLELRGPGGARLPLQELPPGHNFMPHLPWRKRVVFEVELPPRSSSRFTLGWVEGSRPVPARGRAASALGADRIGNARLRVTAEVGARGVRVFHGGRSLLAAPGLGALLVEDPYGPWGGHYEEPPSLALHTVRERWRIVAARVVEAGPVRAALWCRLAGARSEAELTFRLGAADAHATVEARVFLNERRARLKLVLPGGDTADFAVPGGVIRRGPQGEVCGGRWARVLDRQGRPRFILASDALYGFDARAGSFFVTVVRSARHTMDRPEPAAALPPEEPVLDRGEFQFRLLIGAPTRATLDAAARLEQPPLVMQLPRMNVTARA